jgi:hypothetical protein
MKKYYDNITAFLSNWNKNDSYVFKLKQEKFALEEAIRAQRRCTGMALLSI